MNRICCTLTLILISAVAASGQSKPTSLEGAWQAVEVVHTGPHAGTIRPGPNLSIWSGTHYARVLVEAKDRPVLVNPASATADQLREVWGPFVAEAGSYEATDSVITFHPSAAKNPAAMAPGVSIVASYKLEGKTLTLTVQREWSGPVAYPYTVKLVRVE